jgi:integrase
MSPPFRPKGEAWEIRVTYGAKLRLSVLFHGTEKQCEFREQAIGVAVAALVKAGHLHEVKRVAKALARAASVDEVQKIVVRAQHSALHPMTVSRGTTYKDVAELWLGGDLRKRFPDKVRSLNAKSVKDNRSRLEEYIYPQLDTLVMADFKKLHGNSVMAMIPDDVGPVYRRHIAQTMRKVVQYAVEPLGLLEFNPLPRGFLPLIPKGKAKAYLFPDEDAKLVSSKALPLVRRLFWGILNREGFRLTEGLTLDWADVDMDHGVINLDKNKTSNPRAWKGAVDSMAAFALLKSLGHTRPFAELGTLHHAAEALREDLTAAGVNRHALHHSSENRTHIRAHDLRATFTTISIANGKTENWIALRTGHTTHAMIEKYRRAAATIAELDLGPLKDMREVVPELRGSRWGARGNNGESAKKRGGAKKGRKKS